MAYPRPATVSGGPPSQGFFQAAFADLSSSSSSSGGRERQDERPFDPFEWYPSYQSCQRYFLDTAQHQEPVKV